MTLAEQLIAIAGQVGETHPFCAARLRVIAREVADKEEILDDIIADVLRDAREGRLSGYEAATPSPGKVLAFPGGSR